MPAVQCDPAKKRTHRHAILTELREQQELAMADLRNPETGPQARAQLMRAYVECQKQRNVERMRPAPKPIDVSDHRKRKPRAPTAPTIQAAEPTPSVSTPAPPLSTSTP